MLLQKQTEMHFFIIQNVLFSLKYSMLKKKVKEIMEYINNPLESSELVTQWIVQLLCKLYFWVYSCPISSLEYY